MKFARPSLVSKRTRITIAAVAAASVISGFVLPIAASAANPTASAGNTAVTEGDSGTAPADVTFTLSQASPNKTTVTYTTADGTATAPADYVTQTGTVVFNAGETTKRVAFSVRGDTVDESTENFKVNVTAVDNSYDIGTPGTVTITDNDAAPSVSVDNKSQDEGSSGGFTNMPFIARLSAPAGSSITYFAFTNDPEHDTNPSQAGNQFLSPKADAGTDYTAVAGATVTFATGDTVATVNVPIKGDLTDESNEFFELQLKATNSATAPTVAYGDGTILDDDAPARLDVSDPTPVNEGNTTCGGLGDPCDSADTKITFTVTLSPASEKRVVVDFGTSDRSATTSTDYVSAGGSGDPSATPPGSGLVFLPGETSKTVNVFIKGDTQAEPIERFALNLSNPVNATLGDSQAFGTILNDDGGTFATVTVTNAPTTAEASGSPKAAGTATFTINVNRTGTLDTATYQVAYQTADGPESSSSPCGKAVAGKDYVARTGTASIAFPQSSTTVAVTLIDDVQNEADECFQLQLNDATNASISDAVGEAKITDDDPAPSLAIVPKSITEGTGTDTTTAPMTVTLTPASGREVSVTCATTDNSGTATQPEDYVKTTRTITFSPGETSKTCDIPVVADAIDENNETLSVALSNQQGAVIGTGTAVLIINDDDLPPTVVIGNTTVTEGTGTDSVATLPVTLSAPSGKAITVRATTANGTATAPGDYTTTASDLTFNPGETQKDFQVPVKADAVDETDETFTGTLTESADTVTLGTATGTATILDDDDPPGLAINDVTVTEGNSGTTNAIFTVTRSGATEKTATVHYATGTTGTATSTTDYTATTGDLTFAPGDTTETITVPVKGDTVDESDETFNVDLSAPTNATISDARGTGTITDDDPATPPTTTPPTTTPPTTTPPTTTPPVTPSAKITTVAGPGGGPHVRQFNPNGTATGPGFFDGAETTGKRVARGDLDNDGVEEIITSGGADSSGYVSVYTAAGSLITSVLPYGDFRNGIFVAAGDVDGDGTDEVITGAGAGGGPHVRTFKLSGGSLVGSNGFYAFDPSFGGGVTVGAGDLNNDNKDEILTGMASQGSLLRSFAYTGTGGATRGVEIAPYGAFTGGVFPAAGDLTGDGNAEIVTATGPGGGGDPHLRTFTPGGLAIGNGIYAYNVGFRGGFTVAVGDLDGDNKGEIITGAGPTGGPHVKVYTANLAQQREFFAYGATFLGGVWVAVGTS